MTTTQQAIQNSVRTANTIELTYTAEIEAELTELSESRTNAGGSNYIYYGADLSGRDWSIQLNRY